MERLIIRGGNPLHGEVRLNGSKYSALAAIPASLLADTPTTICNLPNITDVTVYLEILRFLGADIRTVDGRVTIDGRGLNRTKAPAELIRKLRASYYLLGALLAIKGEAEVALPGGDEIGSRPIDLHVKGLRAMGAEIQVTNEMIYARAERLKGAEIYCDVPSVGATFNLMIAAVKAEGTTTILNAYSAPWIVDLADYLNAQGAKIVGAGTDTITIQGVDRLEGCEHSLIGDQTEAATFMIAVAIAGGRVRIRDLVPDHMAALTAKLREAGVSVEAGDDYLIVEASGRPYAINVITGPYPGFYTDFQPMTTAWLACGRGVSTVTEHIWPDRFAYVDGLRQMGAKIRVEGGQAVISGARRLIGARLMAGDIRAAASFVLAGLGAVGITEVSGIYHLDRGYSSLETKLSKLGADIQRISASTLLASAGQL